MSDKPEVNRNISIEIHGDINIINRSPKAWLFRKSSKENKHSILNASEKPVIDRKSIEWIEKYGHILWVP
jgi:hypothetical protein